MLIPFKYGLERTNIGTEEILTYCPACESDQWADIMVSSVYTHVYFIPFYPSDKDVYIHCSKCGLKRYGVPFNKRNFKDYEEMRSRYRHPWYTFTGVMILASPFLLGIFVWLYNQLLN